MMKNLFRKSGWLIFVLIFCSPALMAQQDTVDLKEIRVSSVANPVSKKKIPRLINIVSHEEIKNIPANSIGDILEQVAGLDVRQRGVFGMQQDLSTDGGSFDQTLILINGIPVNDPQTGHHNLDQALSMADISKIEIIRGPASRWFGPDAFAGAVNIITGQNDAVNRMVLDMSAGQYGLFTGSLSAGYHTGRLQNWTSVNGGRSDGYRINTDFHNLGFSHGSSLKVKNTLLNLQLGYKSKAFGANSFYTALFPDQYEKIKVMSAAVGIRGGKKVRFNGNLRWRRLYDRFELFREGEGWYQKQGDWYVRGEDSAGFQTPAGFFPYRGPNFHRTDVAGGEGSLTFSTTAGKTTAGASYQFDKILSNVLGFPMSDTVFSTRDKGAWYDRNKERHLFNLYLNQLYQKQKFSLSGGLNLFYSPGFGLLLSPGLDVSWFSSADVKVWFSANRGIRLPTFTDLYYQGPDHLSNPHLKPEKVYGFSGGVQYFLKNVTFSATLSYRMGYDVIDWVKKEADSKWESRNLTRLNTLGAGFSVDYSPGDHAGFIKHVRSSYHYLYSAKTAGDYVSLYALDYLRHHFTVYLEHRISGRISAGWTFSVEKRNGGYFDYERQQKVSYKTVFLLNTKIKYTLPHFTFYVQADNLFNQQYRDIGSVVMPGIWVRGGIQYRFRLKKDAK
jgi:vitamin B12 transporter